MYKITIEETREVTVTKGKEWVVVGTNEVERKASMFDPLDKDEPKTRIENKHGYSPEYEKKENQTFKIYEQQVEELNINDVIIAINKIGSK